MSSLPERYTRLLLAAAFIVGAGFLYRFGMHAYDLNGRPGFPLDDPWIHLQFAKNLSGYGSFSYFKNEMVTAGSTSPLYTILLAGGFFFTSNEMILSYILGIAFLLLAAFFMFRILSLHDPARTAGGDLVRGAPLLLLLLEPRMQWAAFSGMETTLFICLLLASTFSYLARRAVPFGLTAGLLFWARPEAVLFFIAVAVDVLYHARWVANPRIKKKARPAISESIAWLKPSLVIAGICVGGYVLFNLFLSGSILPNTYAAKVKYYSSSLTAEFPGEVLGFLASGHMSIPAALAGLFLVRVFFKLFRREPQAHLLFPLFTIGMFLAYWVKLPFLYQEGRYLMPVIPFVILMAAAGLRDVIEIGRRRFRMRRRAEVVVQTALVLTVAVLFVSSSGTKSEEFALTCRYISERQVRTAHWLREHTPENAIVATHDIGAIAFYSGRRIVDMVGLVSPEMIESIGSLSRLHQFLVNNNVTHVAVLRNWFEIVNQQPLFTTDEREPEIMEVFTFDRRRTHLTPQDVTRATEFAAQLVARGQSQAAQQVLQDALVRDPGNSRVRTMLGTTLLMARRWDEAGREFETALRLFPESPAAQIGMAQVAAAQNKPQEAVARLESAARLHPEYPPVYRALAEVYGAFKLDSVKANSYLLQFNSLMNARP